MEDLDREIELSDRFTPLNRYFKGIRYRDLLTLSADDIVSSVDVSERILMRLCLCELQAELEMHPTTSSLEYALSLSGRLISVKLPKRRNDLHTIPELSSWLGDDFCTGMQLIDMSDNILLSEDLPDITTVVKDATSCTVLDLSKTRIGQEFKDDLSKWLTELLEIEHLQFVDLCDTNIYSKSAAPMLSNMEDKLIAKLIFVRPCHLHLKAWHKLVNPSVCDAVIASHETYYQLRGLL